MEKNLKISKIAKFGCKMLWNTQNIALRWLQNSHQFRLKSNAFPSVIQLSIQILSKLSQGYIFRILTHFTTKLCHFTNFVMIFLAMLIDFVFLPMLSLSLTLSIP